MDLSKTIGLAVGDPCGMVTENGQLIGRLFVLVHFGPKRLLKLAQLAGAYLKKSRKGSVGERLCGNEDSTENREQDCRDG